MQLQECIACRSAKDGFSQEKPSGKVPGCPPQPVPILEYQYRLSSMFMYLNLRSGATLGYLMVSQYKSVSYVFVLRGQGWPRTVGHDH